MYCRLWRARDILNDRLIECHATGTYSMSQYLRARRLLSRLWRPVAMGDDSMSARCRTLAHRAASPCPASCVRTIFLTWRAGHQTRVHNWDIGKHFLPARAVTPHRHPSHSPLPHSSHSHLGTSSRACTKPPTPRPPTPPLPRPQRARRTPCAVTLCKSSRRGMLLRFHANNPGVWFLHCGSPTHPTSSLFPPSTHACSLPPPTQVINHLNANLTFTLLATPLHNKYVHPFRSPSSPLTALPLASPLWAHPPPTSPGSHAARSQIASGATHSRAREVLAQGSTLHSFSPDHRVCGPGCGSPSSAGRPGA